MKVKTLLTGATSAALLFLLAGCGFKLDNAMLSKDGGIWTSNIGGTYQFSDDGKVSLYDNKEKVAEGTYSVSDTDNGYELTLDTAGSKLGVANGSMTIEVPKKDQKSDEFKGEAKVSAGIGALKGESSEAVTFKKENKDYLN